MYLLAIFLIVTILYGSSAVNETGYFWHITDLHYDHTYWTDQLSCIEQVKTRGQYGDGWCDTPWLLVTDSIGAMARIKSDVDFILWTGDNVAHIADRNMTLNVSLEILQNITETIIKSFQNTPVYASLGNHDFYPDSQVADPDNSGIYQRVATMWEQWIRNQSQVDNFNRGGYYMARLTSKIRLLALNTNIYYLRNKLARNDSDPAGQLAWMSAQFREARSAKEKVIVTGHVPPGLVTPGLTDRFYPNHKRAFIGLLLEYSDVILATHFGHDHTDGFKILQNKDGNRAVTQFTAPSVSPMRYKIGSFESPRRNPGVRLVQYDPVTGDNINYVQYYINLTDSNNRNRTNWAELYSFRDIYKVRDMSVTSLREIFARMESSAGTYYSNKYCTFSLVSNYDIICTPDMRAEIYCGGLNYDLTEAQGCKQNYLKSLNGVSCPHIKSYIVVVALLLEVSIVLLY